MRVTKPRKRSHDARLKDGPPPVKPGQKRVMVHHVPGYSSADCETFVTVPAPPWEESEGMGNDADSA